MEKLNHKNYRFVDVREKFVDELIVEAIKDASYRHDGGVLPYRFNRVDFLRALIIRSKGFVAEVFVDDLIEELKCYGIGGFMISETHSGFYVVDEIERKDD